MSKVGERMEGINVKEHKRLVSAINAQVSRMNARPPVATPADMGEDWQPAVGYHSSDLPVAMQLLAAGLGLTLSRQQVNTLAQFAFLTGFQSCRAAAAGRQAEWAEQQAERKAGGTGQRSG